MWMQNRLLRKYVGFAITALLLIASLPANSEADEPATAEGDQANVNRADANAEQNPTAAVNPPSLPPAPSAFRPQRDPRGALPSVPQAAQYPQQTTPYSPYAAQHPQQSAQFAQPPANYPGAPAPFASPSQRPALSPPNSSRYPSYVLPASAATRPQTPATTLSPLSGTGLPDGEWTNDTPLGKIKMTVSGNKISIQVDGAGELELFKPALRGEYSVASDGTIYGLIHTVDMGVPAAAASEMGDELVFLSGLSDIPFSMRAYSEPGVLAIKQITFGLPMQLMIATDGDASRFTVYAQSMLTGLYDQTGQ